MNGPKTMLGALVLFFIYFVISLTNVECTLAKSSRRNSTVLSASSNSFFSATSKSEKKKQLYILSNQI